MEIATQTANPITQFLSDLFNFLITLSLLTTIITISIFLVNLLASKTVFTKRLKSILTRKDNVFLFIKIPQTNEQKEDSMENFLHSLHRVLPNIYLSLEMASTNQFLRFYITIPKSIKSIVESQIYAYYPEAELEETEEFLPQINKNAALVEFGFKKSSINPINSYLNMGEDLLKNLSALLSKNEVFDQVFFQLVLQKVGSGLTQRGFKAGYFKLFGKKSESENASTIAQTKLSQDLYFGKLRIAFLSTDKSLAQTKLNALVGFYKGVKNSHNELKAKSVNNFLPFIARIFEKGDLFTCAEIATLYHFPYNGSIVSNVVNTTSKRAPAPDILPFYGQVEPKEVSFFGETNYRNERKIFGLKRADRRRHLYVVGKTGSGKSKLLELLIISDILNGEGCCLLDPHGDLATELLKFIPKERVRDVVYINPADTTFPIGFNPLESVDDFEVRQHLAAFFISIFKKLFAVNWNPRMEHLIRYITLALLETPDSSVLGIPRILSDTKFRQRVTMQIQDPVVKSFWTNEFSASAEAYSREAVVPILNKVGQFISNPIVRNMVGQRKNTLHFDKFMNEGKIVIINISKGKLGDENSALLGSMFITKIQQAALARANVQEEERRDFYFYVDEFQNFATDAFSSILSEARKYHLDLTIAHQYIAQLPEDVKATAFGNVGSIIVFPIGGDDAAYLAKEFTPVFTADDMINLNLREMYIKMSVDGKLTPPFSAKTITVPKPGTDYSEEILSHSRLTYGKNRVVVENEIKRWAESTEPVSTSSEDFPEPIL